MRGLGSRSRWWSNIDIKHDQDCGYNLVAVKTAYEEQALTEAAKRNSARWSIERRVWVMPYTVAVALGLKGWNVDGLAEQCSDVELYDD